MMKTYAFSQGSGAWTVIRGTTVELPDRTISDVWVAGLEDEERAELGIVEVLTTPAPPLPPGLEAIEYVSDGAEGPVQGWSVDHISDEVLLDAQVAAVNAERDRRINAGVLFAGNLFQSEQSDRENIMGLGEDALRAIASGAAVGDLRWSDPDNDFVFILEDNSTVPMDAHEMAALYAAGKAQKASLTFAARAKKNWLQDPERTREERLAFDATADWPA